MSVLLCHASLHEIWCWFNWRNFCFFNFDRSLMTHIYYSSLDSQEHFDIWYAYIHHQWIIKIKNTKIAIIKP